MLDSRRQQLRVIPAETAHDEAPQHTAKVRHDDITQAWMAENSAETVDGLDV